MAAILNDFWVNAIKYENDDNDNVHDNDDYDNNDDDGNDNNNQTANDRWRLETVAAAAVAVNCAVQLFNDDWMWQLCI